MTDEAKNQPCNLAHADPHEEAPPRNPADDYALSTADADADAKASPDYSRKQPSVMI